MTKIFKVTAYGDTMYFRAPNLDDAKAQLSALCGPLAGASIKWEEVSELPDGEEFAADVR